MSKKPVVVKKDVEWLRQVLAASPAPVCGECGAWLHGARVRGIEADGLPVRIFSCDACGSSTLRVGVPPGGQAPEWMADVRAALPTMGPVTWWRWSEHDESGGKG